MGRAPAARPVEYQSLAELEAPTHQTAHRFNPVETAFNLEGAAAQVRREWCQPEVQEARAKCVCLFSKSIIDVRDLLLSIVNDY